MIYAVDPGTEQSAFVTYDAGRIVDSAIEPNADLLARLRTASLSVPATLALEMVASYGMPVGREVFETVLWIGRFVEAWESVASWGRRPHELVYRRDVKLHLCGSARAKDANIRQAILDRYPRTGGGKTPQIGTKSQPGPLYGISSHLWAALAVAIYADDLRSARAAA